MIKEFNGKAPKMADSALISEAAYIIGDVEIGDDASVWPGAVIRGDMEKIIIGKGTIVEDNSVIHSGIIGDAVHIGHGAVVNCKKIGSHVLIGINSTILHNAEIGDYCIIGANCMVGEEMKVPDKSFVVGVPGRIEGNVTGKKLFWIEEAPKYYARLIEKYKGNRPR